MNHQRPVQTDLWHQTGAATYRKTTFRAWRGVLSERQTVHVNPGYVGAALLPLLFVVEIERHRVSGTVNTIQQLWPCADRLTPLTVGPIGRGGKLSRWRSASCPHLDWVPHALNAVLQVLLAADDGWYRKPRCMYQTGELTNAAAQLSQA